MKPKLSPVLLLLLLLAGPTFAQTTAFNYQGRLTDAGLPAHANYDFQFTIFDAANGGNSIGSLQRLNVAVVNGAFSVNLDFGVGAFPGPDRFMEIAVRKIGGAFTTLLPRQQILSTPYSIKSLSADNSTNLGGVSSSLYVQKDAAGNISEAGTLSMSTLNATTQFNLGGQRILSNPGTNNLFAGVGAGTVNTSGFDNAFFGQGAGQVNTTGFENSFFGKSSGLRNTTGNDNSFFGINAGINNLTGSGNTFAGAAAGTSSQIGDNNSFFGRFSGLKNTVSNNSFFGAFSGQENTTGTGNSFFGSGSGFSNTTGPENSFFGLSAGSNNTTGGSNSFFGFNAGLLNTQASQNSFFGASAGFSTTTGGGNTFVGHQAGLFNQIGAFNTFVGRFAGLNNTASFNAFFGAGAGEQNTAGTNNTFVGTSSGGANVTGSDNSFFGRDAGRNNIGGNDSFSGSHNTFVGSSAGLNNTTGFGNSFFGNSSGQANTTGTNNSFFGYNAGLHGGGAGNSYFGSEAGSNASTGTFSNSFFGSGSGSNNTDGFFNTFIGASAGLSNTTGSSLTMIGNAANVGAVNLTNATAIGAGTVVSQSNSLVLGNNANVGIGTSAPASKLTVVGAIESTTGGVKFPDGTIQTTAAGATNAILNQTTPQAGANFNISGNGTVGGTLTANSLSGNGANITNINASNITTGTLNNARLGLIPTANIADGAVTAIKIASGQVVRSVNGLNDNITLAAGSNITITPAGNTLTIASAGGGGLTLPFTGSQSDAGNLLGLTNTGNGGAGSFAISNPANTNPALTATTNGTGPAFTATGTINTTTQYNIGGSRVLSTPGIDSLWIGKGAGGVVPTPGNANDDNTFVGPLAGAANNGCCNSFFGASAGYQNTLGSLNTFLGYISGASNTEGSNNVFIGNGAGAVNNLGANNTFIGNAAGNVNKTGSNNTAVGVGANFGADNLTFATAIGVNAVVTTSNSILLGRVSGADTVRVPGNLIVTGTFSNPSDVRLKTGVANLRYGLNEVMQLRPVTWKWKDRAAGTPQLGLIAQEVRSILPELIIEEKEKDQLLSLNYLGLLPVVIKAIQDQQATITSLRNELDAQNNPNGTKQTVTTYNGNVLTDENGEATVMLSNSVESLNSDFRYQLTVIGQFAQAIISREIENNRFTIKTSTPKVKVSWQVTAIRKN